MVANTWEAFSRAILSWKPPAEGAVVLFTIPSSVPGLSLSRTRRCSSSLLARRLTRLKETLIWPLSHTMNDDTMGQDQLEFKSEPAQDPISKSEVGVVALEQGSSNNSTAPHGIQDLHQYVPQGAPATVKEVYSYYLYYAGNNGIGSFQ